MKSRSTPSQSDENVDCPDSQGFRLIPFPVPATDDASICATRNGGSEAANPISAFVFVRLQAHEREEDAVRYLAALHQVEEIHMIGGEDAYLVRVTAKSPEEMARFIRRRLRGNPHIVSVRTMTVLRTVKQRTSAPRLPRFVLA